MDELLWLKNGDAVCLIKSVPHIFFTCISRNNYQTDYSNTKYAPKVQN